IELQKNGWALLNKIIWYKPNAMPSSLDKRFSNVYEPIFLFVKRESKYNYYFSLDELRLPSKSNFENGKNPEDILDLKVKNSLLKESKIEGRVVKVFRNKNNEILAEVLWEDGKTTIEIVNDFKNESKIPMELICPDCGKTIKSELDLDKHNNCKGFPIPILPPKPDFEDRMELKSSFLFPCKDEIKEYKGKFRLSPENRGASPGARKSLFGEYLVVQRRYEIFQPLIADYLRYWRKKRNISIKKKLMNY
ncbi:MAG: DNA methyltransferase, partial [Caldimicrobium sp.]